MLEETLAEFDERLRRMGAPLLRAWAPGASDARIDAAFLPLGVDLPEEARIWWRWHNGCHPDARSEDALWSFRYPLSLEEAADAYSLAVADDFAAEDIEGLIKTFTDPPYLYFLTSGPKYAPVPVYSQADLERPEEQWPSIDAFVRTYIELIDAGAWTIDGRGTWQANDSLIPERYSRL